MNDIEKELTERNYDVNDKEVKRLIKIIEIQGINNFFRDVFDYPYVQDIFYYEEGEKDEYPNLTYTEKKLGII